MPHHLLVIDDEPFIARIVRSACEAGPFAVSAAFDGRSGLDLLRSRPDVALVLLDLAMPEMSGLEVLEAVRRDPTLAATKVLLLTAAGHQDQVDRARALGIAGIITKPFSPKKLVRQIEELVGVRPVERGDA